MQILIAVGIGIFTAVMIGGYISSIETKYKLGAKKVPVVVTKKYIDAGELIGPEDTEIKEIPSQYLQPRCIQRTKDLLTEKGGLLYMAAVPIDIGEQVVGTKLFPLGEGTGIGAIIPSSFRAVTINAEKVDVINVLVPGNHVDVIGVFEYEDDKSIAHLEALTLLQNVTVLSVGKAVIGAVREVTFKSKKDAAKVLETEQKVGGGTIAVGLAVTPAQAELLALAKNKGVLAFSLRSTGDVMTYDDLPGASMGKIFGKYSGKSETKEDAYLKNIRKQQEEAIKMLEKYKKFAK